MRRVTLVRNPVVWTLICVVAERLTFRVDAVASISKDLLSSPDDDIARGWTSFSQYATQAISAYAIYIRACVLAYKLQTKN